LWDIAKEYDGKVIFYKLNVDNEREVASVFQQEGAICLDADLIAKACLKKGEGGYKAVTSVFGEKIKDEKGSIDKQKLASIVFSDQEKLKTLNALIHPIVHSVIKERIDRLKTELKKVLDYASVNGEDFVIQIIEKILKIDELDLLEHLDNLSQKHGLVTYNTTKSLKEKILTSTALPIPLCINTCMNT
jgi:dephospho-CoA kinase